MTALLSQMDQGLSIMSVGQLYCEQFPQGWAPVTPPSRKCGLSLGAVTIGRPSPDSAPPLTLDIPTSRIWEPSMLLFFTHHPFCGSLWQQCDMQEDAAGCTVTRPPVWLQPSLICSPELRPAFPPPGSLPRTVHREESSLAPRIHFTSDAIWEAGKEVSSTSVALHARIH